MGISQKLLVRFLFKKKCKKGQNLIKNSQICANLTGIQNEQKFSQNHQNFGIFPQNNRRQNLITPGEAFKEIFCGRGVALKRPLPGLLYANILQAKVLHLIITKV